MAKIYNEFRDAFKEISALLIKIEFHMYSGDLLYI